MIQYDSHNKYFHFKQLIDHQNTSKNSKKQISIIKKVLSGYAFKNAHSKSFSLSILYTISTFVFRNPIVFYKNVQFFIQKNNRILKDKLIIYVTPSTKQISLKFEDYYQSNSHIKSNKKNQIFKFKVIKILSRHEQQLNQNELQYAGKYLIQFLSPLNLKKKKQFTNYQTELNRRIRIQQDSSEVCNQIYWGNQDVAKIISKYPKLVFELLKQLKTYQKTKIIRQGVRKAINFLLARNIAVFYNFYQSQYNLLFDQDKKQKYQTIDLSYYQYNLHILKQQSKFLIDINKINNQRQIKKKQFNSYKIISFEKNNLIINKQFNIWKKVNQPVIKKRNQVKVMDKNLNRYLIKDYYIQDY